MFILTLWVTAIVLRGTVIFQLLINCWPLLTSNTQENYTRPILHLMCHGILYKRTFNADIIVSQFSCFTMERTHFSYDLHRIFSLSCSTRGLEQFLSNNSSALDCLPTGVKKHSAFGKAPNSILFKREACFYFYFF